MLFDQCKLRETCYYILYIILIEFYNFVFSYSQSVIVGQTNGQTGRQTSRHVHTFMRTDMTFTITRSCNSLLQKKHNENNYERKKMKLKLKDLKETIKLLKKRWLLRKIQAQ